MEALLLHDTLKLSTDPGDEVSCLFAQRVVGSGLWGTICVSTAVLSVLRTLDLLVSDVEVLLLLLFALSAAWRNYALRRVRDAFKANRNVEDPKAVERLMEEGWQTLALIQRQVSIGKMYEAQKTVVD